MWAETHDTIFSVSFVGRISRALNETFKHVGSISVYGVIVEVTNLLHFYTLNFNIHDNWFLVKFSPKHLSVLRCVSVIELLPPAAAQYPNMVNPGIPHATFYKHEWVNITCYTHSIIFQLRYY